MKRFICVLLCVCIKLSILPVIITANNDITYPHFMNYMEVNDFDDDFKTLGKTYMSLPIIISYDEPNERYSLLKTENNDSVTIEVDGYSGGGEYAYKTLVNAVEAYFSTESAQFVEDNFKYVAFTSVDGVIYEEIGDYYFRTIKGNNHRGFSITIKREPIFLDLLLSEEDKHTMRPSEVAAVIELFGEGIIKGVGNNIFDPDGNVTRAQFAVMLGRLFDIEEIEYKGLFGDVPDGEYYTGAVEAFADMGYLLGYDGMFYPDNTILCQDMYVIVYRYLKDNNLLPEKYESSIIITNFMEKNGIPFDDYAKEAINTLYAMDQLVQGRYIELMREPGTRIQIADFLNLVRKHIIYMT